VAFVNRTEQARGASPSAEFWAGAQAEVPILAGVIPFGLIFGVVATGAGIPPLAAQAFSLIMFGGSAQFVAAQLVGAGAPALLAVLTIFIVNLRHALYSASVGPHFKSLPGRWKVVLAWLLTDEAYAIGVQRYLRRDESPYMHFYFLGAGLTLWATWQLSTAAGILLGAQVPANWGLEFTLALTFIAIVIPGLSRRPAVGAALGSAVLAILLAGLPYKLGLLGAALGGIVAGTLLEGGSSRKARI